MKAASPKTAKISSVLLILISFVLFYFAAQNYWYWYQFEQRANKTEGTIVRFHEGKSGSQSGRSYPVYTPVFSFVDRDGKRHEVEAKSSDPDPTDRIGDKVTVIYESDHPEQARLYRFIEIYIWAAVLGGLGGLLLLVAVINLASFAIKKSKVLWLQDNGQKVQAEIIEIKATKFKQSLITIFTSYEIKAQWKNPSDGQIYIFSNLKNANLILKDPSDKLAREVTVLIDPNNPGKNYWMDLSCLA